MSFFLFLKLHIQTVQTCNLEKLIQYPKAAISMPSLQSKYRAESEIITTSLKLWELYTFSVSHDHVFNSYTKVNI